MIKGYHVTYERDEDGWWVASVREVKGCHTQGRTIEEARNRIREALGLFVKNADAATLVDNIKLPAAAKQAIASYQRLRKCATTAQDRAGAAARDAVRALRRGKLHLSVRDAGALLGLSGQRVQQLER